MPNQNFSFVRSFCGWFFAIQAGGLSICIGIMVLENGLTAIPEGVVMWIVGQIVILPLALFGAVPAALLRMILGLMFQSARVVAPLSGTVIGGLGCIVLMGGASDLDASSVTMIGICAFAGFIGGWTWWRYEKPFLDPAPKTTHETG